MENKEYKIIENYENISVAVEKANIQINNSFDDQTKVEVLENKINACSCCVENEVLTVTRKKRKWYNFFCPSFKAPQITIYLPQKNIKFLHIKCKSGRILINDIKVNGDIDVKTNTTKTKICGVCCNSLSLKGNTAKFNLEKVDVKDKMDIKTNTGKVKLNHCRANEIFVKTNTGNVESSFLFYKSLFVKSNTGKIKIPNTLQDSNAEIISDTDDVTYLSE